MSLITAKNLSIGYDSHVVAEGISFTVSEGDYLCIVGENGAGKSTLMKTLLRLQPPLGGELLFDEKPEDGGIGYLPQQTAIQRDFPASVREIVLSGCRRGKGFMPFYDREDKALADATISEMGIKELSRKCYRELSGGQQQRVLLARALCAAGRVLLLDEPAAGLDPAATEDMYKTISALNEKGMTVIMISHDIEAAVRYASHILMLGRRHFFGRKEDFIKDGADLWYVERGGRANA